MTQLRDEYVTLWYWSNFWVVGNKGRYKVVSKRFWFNIGLVWTRDQHEVGKFVISSFENLGKIVKSERNWLRQASRPFHDGCNGHESEIWKIIQVKKGMTCTEYWCSAVQSW
jgi:hypothetical protein